MIILYSFPIENKDATGLETFDFYVDTDKSLTKDELRRTLTGLDNVKRSEATNFSLDVYSKCLQVLDFLPYEIPRINNIVDVDSINIPTDHGSAEFTVKRIDPVKVF